MNFNPNTALATTFPHLQWSEYPHFESLHPTVSSTPTNPPDLNSLDLNALDDDVLFSSTSLLTASTSSSSSSAASLQAKSVNRQPVPPLTSRKANEVAKQQFSTSLPTSSTSSSSSSATPSNKSEAKDLLFDTIKRKIRALNKTNANLLEHAIRRLLQQNKYDLRDFLFVAASRASISVFKALVSAISPQQRNSILVNREPINVVDISHYCDEVSCKQEIQSNFIEYLIITKFPEGLELVLESIRELPTEQQELIFSTNPISRQAVLTLALKAYTFYAPRPDDPEKERNRDRQERAKKNVGHLVNFFLHSNIPALKRHLNASYEYQDSKNNHLLTLCIKNDWYEIAEQLLALTPDEELSKFLTSDDLIDALAQKRFSTTQNAINFFRNFQRKIESRNIQSHPRLGSQIQQVVITLEAYSFMDKLGRFIQPENKRGIEACDAVFRSLPLEKQQEYFAIAIANNKHVILRHWLNLFPLDQTLCELLSTRKTLCGVNCINYQKNKQVTLNLIERVFWVHNLETMNIFLDKIAGLDQEAIKTLLATNPENNDDPIWKLLFNSVSPPFPISTKIEPTQEPVIQFLEFLEKTKLGDHQLQMVDSHGNTFLHLAAANGWNQAIEKLDKLTLSAETIWFIAYKNGEGT